MENIKARYNGVPIIVSKELIIKNYELRQVRKSKSKRINKKFKIKYGYYKFETGANDSFVFDGCLMISPRTWNKLKSKVNKFGELTLY